MRSYPVFLFLISFFCCFLTKCEERNNIDKEENVKSTTYFCRPLVDCIEKVFSCFNTFDISIRATRISNIYPFFWEKDGALTVRLSFFKIFKNNPFFENNFVFEFNFLKVRDLGGRGFDFLRRRLGRGIIGKNKNKSTANVNGAYFFSMLDKLAFFFSFGIEGNAFYRKLFNWKFAKCGLGFRLPIWSGGPFSLVNDIDMNDGKFQKAKEKGCSKWKNLSKKSPIDGFLYNIVFYMKPFIYEFDNGFRIEYTLDLCINDFRYVFHEIKKDNNHFYIEDKKDSLNCCEKFLYVLKNVFVLKTKFEIGFDLTRVF